MWFELWTESPPKGGRGDSRLSASPFPFDGKRRYSGIDIKKSVEGGLNELAVEGFEGVIVGGRSGGLPAAV